jgi:hypothetical protein
LEGDRHEQDPFSGETRLGLRQEIIIGNRQGLRNGKPKFATTVKVAWLRRGTNLPNLRPRRRLLSGGIGVGPEQVFRPRAFSKWNRSTEQVGVVIMLRKIMLATVCTLVPLASARADVQIGLGVGLPIYGHHHHHHRPYYRPAVGVYVAPTPTYVAPVVVSPPPVPYVAPATPAYYSPVPAYYPPASYVAPPVVAVPRY